MGLVILHKEPGLLSRVETRHTADLGMLPWLWPWEGFLALMPQLPDVLMGTVGGPTFSGWCKDWLDHREGLAMAGGSYWCYIFISRVSLDDWSNTRRSRRARVQLCSAESEWLLGLKVLHVFSSADISWGPSSMSDTGLVIEASEMNTRWFLSSRNLGFSHVVALFFTRSWRSGHSKNCIWRVEEIRKSEKCSLS